MLYLDIIILNILLSAENNHIGRNIIKEDWEFDRLLYFALNDIFKINIKIKKNHD